jgi:uncharacterized membrane protein YidH (DUF202 family)
MSDDGPVDYRFLLANERTFLAYVRTALSASPWSRPAPTSR